MLQCTSMDLTDRFRHDDGYIQQDGGEVLEMGSGSSSCLIFVLGLQLQTVAAFNEVYRTYFQPPYPNRATIVAAALAIPGMRIEVVVQAQAPGGWDSQQATQV